MSRGNFVEFVISSSPVGTGLNSLLLMSGVIACFFGKTGANFSLVGRTSGHALTGRILTGELYQYWSQLLVCERGHSMLGIAAATLRVSIRASLAGFEYPATERFQCCCASRLTIENKDANIEYTQGLRHTMKSYVFNRRMVLMLAARSRDNAIFVEANDRAIRTGGCATPTSAGGSGIPGNDSPVKFEPTRLPGIVRIVPTLHKDSRGFFMETWQSNRFAKNGIDAAFVQENFSHSSIGTLRGLHYQIEKPQGRLVRVVQGAVFDVAVDLRRSSPHFGQWVGEILSAENRHQLWVPPGFGHGFLVLSETAGFEYNCTNYYSPEFDRAIRWDDPTIGIEWPETAGEQPLLSDKDAAAPFLQTAEIYP